MGGNQPDCLCQLVSFSGCSGGTATEQTFANSRVHFVSNTLLAACLACPGFFLPIESYQIALYLKLSAMLFAATVTLFVLFFPLLTVISRFICFRYLTRPSAAGDICNDSSDGSPAGQAYKSYYHPGNTQRFNENLAAKNLLDFSVQAHEGVLPVKKVTKFNFMSIWELKHVLVIPSNRFFVLMDVSAVYMQRIVSVWLTNENAAIRTESANA